MARPEPRILTVLDEIRITPNMHRVSLGGEGLAGFPADQSGGYIKLMLSGAEGSKSCVRGHTPSATSHKKALMSTSLCMGQIKNPDRLHIGL